MTNINNSAAANAVAITSSGDILLATYGYDNYGQAAVLAEYTPAGSLVGSFGFGGVVTTDIGWAAAWNAITLPGTNILVAGYGQDNWDRDIALAEYDSRGTPISVYLS